MNTKIDQLNLGTTCVGYSAARVRTTKSSDDGIASTGTGASSDDTVELTGDALQLQDLNKSLSGRPNVDTAKVNSLRQAIANGSYRVNAESIASKMLSQEGLLAKS